MNIVCEHDIRLNIEKAAQWFSALTAMAMLSVRTWVQVPPTTSEVLHRKQSFSTQQLNPNANICAMCPNTLAQSYQGYM